MHDLVIRVGHDGPDPIVRLAGELDISTVARLEHQLGSLQDSRVTLDFCGVTFLDSAAIAALTQFQHSIHERGGWLILYGLGAHQLRVLDLFGLLDFFDSIVPE